MADNNLTTKEEFLLNPVEEHNITDAVVASFETNLKHPLKVTVPITPIQDLHGMPNPYPAGASVNLIPDTTDTSNGYVASKYLDVNGNAVDSSYCYISEYFEIDPATTYTWSNRVNTSTVGSIGFYDENKDFISGIAINGQYSHTFIPPEGSVYCRSTQTTYAFQESNPTGGAAYQLEIGSTATPYRRYSNICPIDGYNKVNVFHAPKNLLPKTLPSTAISGSFSTGSTSISSAANARVFSIYVGKNRKLYYSRSSSGSVAIAFAFTDAPVVTRTGVVLYDAINCANRASEFFDSGNHPYLVVSISSAGVYNVIIDTAKLQLIDRFSGQNYSYTERENWKPFTIAFTDPSTGDPMTVYNGSLTLNEDGSVDLVSTKYYRKIKDWPSWSRYASTNYFRTATQDGYIEGITCECYANRTITSSVENYSIGFAGTRLAVKDTRFTDVDSWLAEMGDYRVAINVPSSRYRHYHFPNVGQLKVFLGENNVWSDIGNVNVKYLTQHSETGLEYRGDRALELRRRAMMADAPTIHTTVGSEETGGLASFKSYVKAPVKKIEIPFSPKQDLNGYDHPWPAGGGTNIWDEEWELGAISTTDGTNIENSTQIRAKNYISVIPGNQYYVVKGSLWYLFYDENKNVLSEGLPDTQSAGNARLFLKGVITIPENCYYIRFYAQASYGTVYNNDIAINYPATATAYSPYENICPIEGYDEANIEHAKEYHLCEPSSIQIGQVVSKSGMNITYLGDGVFRAYGTTSATVTSPYVYFIPFIAPSGNAARIHFNNTLADNYISINVYSNSNYSSFVLSNRNRTSGYSIINGQTIDKFAVIGYGAKTFDFTFKIEFEINKVNPFTLTFNQSGDHAFLPIQEGSGNPSPENVRPIHPGLTFTRDDDSVLTVWGGILTVNSDGSSVLTSNRDVARYPFTIMSHAAEPAKDAIRTRIALSGSTTYTDVSGVSNKLKFVTATADRLVNTFYGDSSSSVQCMIPDNVDEDTFLQDLEISYVLATPTTYTLSVTETNRALEALGLTDHIGPLYGGTITINPDGSADVVRTIQELTVDGTYADLSMVGTSYVRIVSPYSFDTATYRTNGFCNMYKPSGAGTNNTIYLASNTVLRAYDNTITSIEYAREKYAATPLQVAFPLAEPQTYHFSNLEQLKVWLGENNFWCDISDDITVKYWNRG